MQGEIGTQAPATDNGIKHITRPAGEGPAFAEGEIVREIAVEQAGNIGDALSIIVERMVSILEEEREAGLAGRSGQRFFVAERTEVAEAVVHALGPGVIRSIG